VAEPLNVVMNEAKHQFEVTLEGETAFAKYHLEPGAIVFPHTVVPAAFEGRGVGGALAKAGLGYAREHGLQVKPTCTFFAGYIAKHPEWHDLVHPDFRQRLGIAVA
jgi:predicted GNAT family acetyltransferase